MENYLNKDEQKFFFQGDMSAYRGMTGFEMKFELDDIESRFMKWYFRTVYEECFSVIMQFSVDGFRSELPAIKDSLYVIHEKQIMENSSNIFSAPTTKEICKWLDEFFNVDRFSDQYAEIGSIMEELLSEKNSEIDEFLKFNIQYELILPGSILSTNAGLQNEGNLIWTINLFKFLADDYVIAAESRAANLWAYTVTILLIVFSVYCFRKY